MYWTYFLPPVDGNKARVVRKCPGPFHWSLWKPCWTHRQHLTTGRELNFKVTVEVPQKKAPQVQVPALTHSELHCVVGELEHGCYHAGPNDWTWLPLSRVITLIPATPGHPPSFCYLYPNYHPSHLPSSASYLFFKIKFKSHLPPVCLDSVVGSKEYFLISSVRSTLSHMTFNSLDTVTTYDAHTTMDKYRGAQAKIIIFLPHIQIKVKKWI